MLKQVFIFITAFAMFIIAMSALEFLVPLLLGIDGLEAEAMQDPKRIQSFMERQPAAYYVGLVLVHFVGSLVGGLVLGLGGLPRWSAYLLVACCMAIGSVFMLPGHPTWYRVMDLINYMPGVLLGYEWVTHTKKLVAKKTETV